MDNSFIYTISSLERLNTENVPIEYDLNFGGFGSQYEDFKVEILGLEFYNGFDYTHNSFFIIALDDLASNGVFCQSLGGNSVLFPINVSDDQSATYNTNKNIFFNVNNCRLARRIKMRMLSSNFNPVEVGVNIDDTSAIEWFLTMKVTPIIN